MAPIVFYDLIPSHSPSPDSPCGKAFFSPAATKTRLSFAQKGIPFTVRELSYKELRTGGWKEKFGVELATVPFIQKEDGTFLMESLDITQWLEETYPDRPSAILPNAKTPIDVTSPEYKQAFEDYKSFRTKVPWNFEPIFNLYAPKLADSLDKEGEDNDFDYWTSDKRLGPGHEVWQGIIAHKREDLIAQAIAESITPLSAYLAEGNRQFFTTPTAPGLLDFLFMGVARLLASTSRENLEAVFIHGDTSGRIGKWYEVMREKYKSVLEEVEERDPK